MSGFEQWQVYVITKQIHVLTRLFCETLILGQGFIELHILERVKTHNICGSCGWQYVLDYSGVNVYVDMCTHSAHFCICRASSRTLIVSKVVFAVGFHYVRVTQ